MPTDWTTYTPPPNRLTDDDLHDALRLAGVHALLALTPNQQRAMLAKVLPSDDDVADALRMLSSQGERLTNW